MKTPLFSLLTAALLTANALATPLNKFGDDLAAERARLAQMTARFAPTDVTADLSKLSPDERRVLAKLVEASKIIDGIFLRQVWSGDVSMLLDLAADQTLEGHARLHYFIINRGPWSRLDEDKPFVAGSPGKPPNGGFYPDDVSKQEIEQWIGSLPEK